MPPNSRCDRDFAERRLLLFVLAIIHFLARSCGEQANANQNIMFHSKYVSCPLTCARCCGIADSERVCLQVRLQGSFSRGLAIINNKFLARVSTRFVRLVVHPRKNVAAIRAARAANNAPINNAKW